MLNSSNNWRLSINFRWILTLHASKPTLIIGKITYENLVSPIQGEKVKHKEEK